MTYPALHILICTLWAATAAAVAFYVLRVATNLTYVTLADGRRELRRLPLMFRLLLPLTSNFDPLFQRQSFTRERRPAEPPDYYGRV